MVINPYFWTAEPNDNRYKGDIVKYTAKNRLDRRKIVITQIVSSRFCCNDCLAYHRSLKDTISSKGQISRTQGQGISGTLGMGFFPGFWPIRKTWGATVPVEESVLVVPLCLRKRLQSELSWCPTDLWEWPVCLLLPWAMRSEWTTTKVRGTRLGGLYVWSCFHGSIRLKWHANRKGSLP